MSNSTPIPNGILFHNQNTSETITPSNSFLRLGDNEIRLHRNEGTSTNGLFLINDASEGDVTLLRHSDDNYLIFEDDRFALRVDGYSIFDFNISNSQVSLVSNPGIVEFESKLEIGSSITTIPSVMLKS